MLPSSAIRLKFAELCRKKWCFSNGLCARKSSFDVCEWKEKQMKKKRAKRYSFYNVHLCVHEINEMLSCIFSSTGYCRFKKRLRQTKWSLMSRLVVVQN